MIDRFAPSPTGPLHVGNLRTAVIAWLCAHQQDGELLLRFEDLDRANSKPEHEVRQVNELAQLGITFGSNVIRQSERFDLYREIVEGLRQQDLVYPCYCTRREILESTQAPHGPAIEGAYAGTCRNLSARDRSEREQSGRPPAWRLRTNNEEYLVDDVIAGPTPTVIDDMVLLRNDGVPAYNLAVVVDDAAQGVTQIVRGDDLLLGTGRHIHLQKLLGYPTPQYVHVPLVVGPDQERLAKRHGAVTLEDLGQRGIGTQEFLGELARSIGSVVERLKDVADLLDDFNLDRLPRSPWTIPSHWQTDHHDN
ncbi:MAG: tRNA glutamyl-Q(34) synthetase GluQRS [Actinomycetota bacterium]|nr:tRNA glutamyl-Q(34) synthetase GluQRS [Actinomycetota bacterium]